MPKKPITIKVDQSLLDRLDKFQVKLPFPATRTGLIETAIEQMLTREEKKGERR
jgi:predicted transcriptional regulator